MSLINVSQLQNLSHFYHLPDSSLHFIFGASKSGKSTFIRDFITKKNHIYFSNSYMSKNLLFSSYVDIINKKFNLKNSSKLYKSFDQVLDLLLDLQIEEKLSIIFDDFHDLLKIDKDALGTFLKIWNKLLSKKNVQIIIVSGTLFNEKQNKLLSSLKKDVIILDDFSSENIFSQKKISAIDRFYTFSCFGTSNYILNSFNVKNDVLKNIYTIALDPSSVFFNYGFDYLRKDISDISTFCSILYALAMGNNKLGQIAEVLDVKSTYLTRYMIKLQDLMIIKKELPLGKNHTFSKYGRYHIKDNFLKFWFCYVFPNISYLQMKKHNLVLKDIDNTITKNILTPAYISYMTNEIKNNNLQYLNFQAIQFGAWWDNNNNFIDIIAFDNTQIAFIKIIWDTPEVAKTLYSELKRTSDNFKTTLKRNYIIISKNTYLNNN